MFQALKEWPREYQFRTEKKNIKLFDIVPNLLCFWHFDSFTPYPLTYAVSSLYQHISKSAFVYQLTDSSDNSDLEDDIILSLNEWGASGTEHLDNMSRLLPHRYLSCRTEGREERMISADKVGDNLEHCQFETVGVCTLWDRTNGDWKK